MFVHELSQQPIQNTADRRSSLQDSDIMIEYDKGILIMFFLSLIPSVVNVNFKQFNKCVNKRRLKFFNKNLF